MIVAILLVAASENINSSAVTIFAAMIGGLVGSGGTIIYQKYSNSIQKMTCQYIDDDVITKIPVITEQGEHKNIHTKEFKLINTTNRDIRLFKIIFEFDAQSKILKHDTFCKTGKNAHKPRISKPNECIFVIKNFNRGDDTKFKFDIANLTDDVYNITEAECTGFKIVLKDLRKAHKKKHGKIVSKEQII
jgi:hypothetical protein